MERKRRRSSSSYSQWAQAPLGALTSCNKSLVAGLKKVNPVSVNYAIWSSDPVTALTARRFRYGVTRLHLPARSFTKYAESQMNRKTRKKCVPLARNPSYVLLAGPFGLQSVFFTSLRKTAFLTTPNGLRDGHFRFLS
jgi:hypothetical protein